MICRYHFGIHLHTLWKFPYCCREKEKSYLKKSYFFYYWLFCLEIYVCFYLARSSEHHFIANFVFKSVCFLQGSSSERVTGKSKRNFHKCYTYIHPLIHPYIHICMYCQDKCCIYGALRVHRVWCIGWKYFQECTRNWRNSNLKQIFMPSYGFFLKIITCMIKSCFHLIGNYKFSSAVYFWPCILIFVR